MKTKKRVLIVYPDMIIGGSTTALLAMLRKIDYSRVSVDLQFLHNGSFRLEELPPEVHVLPDAVQQDLQSSEVRRKKIGNFIFTGKAASAVVHTLGWKRPFRTYFAAAVNQMLARIHCEISRAPEQEYDLAIAYLELWPTFYTAEKVKAKRKVAWCHVDYPAARLNPALDRWYYSKMDKIYCVSADCADNFGKCFPELQDRVDWTENLIDEYTILQKAEDADLLEPEFSDYGGFRIVTVARLDSYTKGLDRITAIGSGLMKAGFDFRWYLVGGGPDAEMLKKSITEKAVSDRLLLLGPKENPYPYMKQASLFVLTSRNEGKPVTVTEAQILHTPILVTEYASAREQLAGSGGMVVPNEEEAVYQKLQQILSGKVQLNKTVYVPAGESGMYQTLDV